MALPVNLDTSQSFKPSAATQNPLVQLKNALKQTEKVVRSEEHSAQNKNTSEETPTLQKEAKDGMKLVAKSLISMANRGFSISLSQTEATLNNTSSTLASDLFASPPLSFEDQVDLSATLKKQTGSETQQKQSENQTSMFTENKDGTLLAKQQPNLPQQPLHKQVKERAKKAAQEKQSTSQFSEDTIQVTEQPVLGAKEKEEKLKKQTTKDVTSKSTEKKASHEHVEAYAKSYISALLGKEEQQTKKKREALRETILKQNISTKALASFEQKVVHSVRHALEDDLRVLVLKKLLSKNGSTDHMFSTKNVHFFLTEKIRKNKVLGSTSFGGYRDGLKGVTKHAHYDCFDEIKDFIKQEGLETITKSRLSQGTLEEGQMKFIELASLSENVGFDFLGWCNMIEETKVHLGLSDEFFDKDDSGKQQEQQQNKQEQQTPSEEELLLNELTACYTERNLRPGLKTYLESTLKIRKLKKKLKKCCPTDWKEKIERSAMEGTALTKLQLIDMLKDAFYERSTLVSLTGPSAKAINKRITYAQRMLKHFGDTLSENHLSTFLNNANFTMFSLNKDRLSDIEIKLKADPGNYAMIRQRKQLISNLTRLKKESGIQDDIYHTISSKVIDFNRETYITENA